MKSVINVLLAGIGGQGVLKASDIVAGAAFRSGYDVKKSELHGMSQRGGSVSSEVRFGSKVYSPMIPDGEADFLLLFREDQEPVVCDRLKKECKVLGPSCIDTKQLENRKSMNIAILGVFSRWLDFPVDAWECEIRNAFPGPLGPVNVKAFSIGRERL